MKPFVTYLVIALLLVALLPYIFICFYTLPFADDFCFGWTASANIPFYQKFLNQYLQWNGRYTADVLCNLHPLTTGRILYYQLAVLVSLLAMPVVLWWFVREVLHSCICHPEQGFAARRILHFPEEPKGKIPHSAEPSFGMTKDEEPGMDGELARRPKHRTARAPIAAVISLLITIFYLNYQPNLTEGIYWFIGIANYHWGLLTFLLHLTLLLKALNTNSTNRLMLVPSLLLLVISIGFNEVGALLIPVFYAIALALNLKSENRKICFTLFVTAILASAFVFFSPGNFIRGNEFKDNYNLLHSLLYASLQTGRFIGTWVFTIPFIPLSVLVLAHAGKVMPQFFKQADYRLMAAFMLFTVFTGSFLPYFATGVLGQHRTINFVFFLFLLQWPLFLIAVGQRFGLHQRLLPLHTPKANTVIFAVSILVMCFTGNGLGITKDLAAGNFTEYEAAFYKRQQAIFNKPTAPINKLEVIPASLKVVDVHSDTAWWVDKCMQKFYIETKIELK